VEQRRFQQLMEDFCDFAGLPKSPLTAPRLSARIGSDAIHIENVEGADSILIWTIAATIDAAQTDGAIVRAALELNLLLAFDGIGAVALDRYEGRLIFARIVDADRLTGSRLDQRLAEFVAGLAFVRTRLAAPPAAGRAPSSGSIGERRPVPTEAETLLAGRVLIYR